MKKSKRAKIDLIPSNSQLNYSIHQIIKKNSFLLNNFYAEGYPYKRYYEGCEEIDKIEILGQSYLQQLYGYPYSNLQLLSGAIANQVVYNAVLNDSDIILTLDIYSGGHISHNKINIVSKQFKFVHYATNENYDIDYKKLKEIALVKKPKLIVAGYSVGTYDIDHKKIKSIAKEVGALYMADMSHIMGLIGAGYMNQPYPHADIVTSTTHKTMSGIKGAIIMCKDPIISKKINTTVFPKTQGGANCSQIIINTLNFEYMLSEEFRTYAKKIISNANTMTKCLNELNISTITKITKNHMNVIDLSQEKLNALKVAKLLDKINIVTNANITKNDTSIYRPTGIRFGTNIITSRNISDEQIKSLCTIIAELIYDIKNNKALENIISYKNKIHKITIFIQNIE